MSNFYLIAQDRKTNRKSTFIAIDNGSYYTYVRKRDKKVFSPTYFHDVFRLIKYGSSEEVLKNNGDWPGCIRS